MMNVRPKLFYVLISIIALIILSGCQNETDLSLRDSAANQATDYFLKGEYEKAVEVSSEIIRMYPEDYVGYYLRGLAYGRLNRYERAIDDYDKALQLDPLTPPTIYNARAVNQRDLGRYELAIQDLNMVIKLNPKGDTNLATAYYGRGTVYWELGRFDEAERDIQKAIELGFDQNLESLLHQITERKAGR